MPRGLFAAENRQPSADWDMLLRLHISPEDLRQGRGGEREGKDGETFFSEAVPGCQFGGAGLASRRVSSKIRFPGDLGVKTWQVSKAENWHYK